MAQQSDPHKPLRWEQGASRTLATTRIFDLRLTEFRHPRRGESREFVVIDAPQWANVVALTPSHELVLVRQFRYGIDEFSLEIPGGVVDRGEDPVVAAVRELREETGYTGGPAVSLGSIHPNPAMQNNRCHLVFVPDTVRTAEVEWDADEEFEIVTKPVDEVYAVARAGGITHSMVLNALFLFEPHWRRIRDGGTAV